MNSKDFRRTNQQMDLISKLTEQVNGLVEQIDDLEEKLDRLNDKRPNLRMLKNEDIQEILDCSYETANKIMNDPELNTVKITKRYLVNEDEFYSWLRKRKRTTMDTPYWRKVSKAA